MYGLEGGGGGLISRYYTGQDKTSNGFFGCLMTLVHLIDSGLYSIKW
jgi:hypothetical protein